MIVTTASRKKLKEVNGYNYVEAAVEIDGLIFKACVQDSPHGVEYFHEINGMKLEGFRLKNSTTQHMKDWANNRIQKFIIEALP